jgi:hypothetical protein
MLFYARGSGAVESDFIHRTKLQELVLDEAELVMGELRSALKVCIDYHLFTVTYIAPQ